jgi:hypothetical protein
MNRGAQILERNANFMRTSLVTCDTIVFNTDMAATGVSRPHRPTLEINEIHHGDCRDLLPCIEKDSVACSVWSPPYFLGKQYEAYLKSF